jgi:predicted XRE-type DNA-binding protein
MRETIPNWKPECVQRYRPAQFGIRQPDVSKLLRGEFRQFSVERLLRFLVALDLDALAI